MAAHPALDATPKVFLAGSDASVTLRVSAPGASGPLRVRLFPAEGHSGRLVHPEAPELVRVPAEGSVTVRCAFPAEQEYYFRLESLTGAAPALVAEARVYAARRDLFDRLPWKGDVHMHSRRSDGQDEPAEVVVAARRIGLDFMALTDHHAYEPSLEAIRAFDGCPTDLVVLPGEEVHPPGCPVHIVHAGGNRSVNSEFTGERYAREVAALAGEVAAETVLGLGSAPREDFAQYAAAAWSFREIRAVGGLAVFCHPSWVAGSRYDVPGALTDLIFARQPYDALELIGGYHVHEAESNDLQVARWAEERARGRRIPVVGVSDAHGCNTGRLWGWYYTVAFAPSPAWPEVLAAIRGEWSVAVDARPGEEPRVFGPYRLALYAHFLLREVMPSHDVVCAGDAELMQRWAGGDRSVAADLEGRRGGVRALYRELWGRG